MAASAAASTHVHLCPPVGERVVRADLPLRAIISGGQTGADQASLRAARALGLSTGGWAPKDWKTLAGPAPWLGTEFGLREFFSGYPARTAANVRDSDATVRLARFLDSPGERCTLKAILKHDRQRLDVWFSRDFPPNQAHERALVDFIRKYDVRVLNVAGNSEETAPGIGADVEQFLLRALSRAT